MPPASTLLLAVRDTPLQPSLAPSCLPDSCHCRTLAADKIASDVTIIWSSSTFYPYHGTQSLLPPSYHISLTQTSKIGRAATHYATVACQLSTYVMSVCIPAPCRTASTVTFRWDSSLHRVACLSVTCLKKLTCPTSSLCIIVSVSTHVSAPNKRTACDYFHCCQLL